MASTASQSGFYDTLPQGITWTKRRALLSQVWRLALPVILTNLLQSLVNVVDVFMVGRLGPIALAAVGISSAIRMLMLVLLISVAAGGMSLISQAKGARDPLRMSNVTRQAVSSGLLLSFVLGALGYLLAEPLLALVNSGGEPEAVKLGTQYLRIIFLGTPFLVLNIVMNRLMQGAGDTITPLLLTGSLNLLNIVFNYIFMFGAGPVPAFGVAGAAMGTVLARGLGVVIIFVVIYSGKNVIKLLPGSYKPQWRMIRDILTIGVPSGVQGVFRNGSRLFVLGIVTSTEVGTYGAAALTIGFQVESLVFMPGLALSVAATSLVGQALGAWQPQEARLRGNMTVISGLVVMTVLAAYRDFRAGHHSSVRSQRASRPAPNRHNLFPHQHCGSAPERGGNDLQWRAARRGRYAAWPHQHYAHTGPDRRGVGLCAGSYPGSRIARCLDCTGGGDCAGRDDHGVSLAQQRLAQRGAAPYGSLPPASASPAAGGPAAIPA